MENSKITYLGFNNFKTHKRGVENVIHFQALASPQKIKYYLHWDDYTNVSRCQNLICIGVKKNAFWFIYLNVILYKLKKKKKLFIHSHNPLMSLMSLYKTDLFTVHDALYYVTGLYHHKLHKIFWILEKLLYKRCRYIHFISDYSKKMSLFKKKNFEIIYNTSHFEGYESINIIDDKDKLSFSNDMFKIFVVRSIEERALINLIIVVAHKLINENIQFFIAGKGPLLDYYRLQIKNLGLNNIKLLGYVSDCQLIKFYEESDLVMVTAANGEGFGLPIIEGYLYNKPVIASNVCAIPEVIISRNFLFENNGESIISRIEFVKNNSQFDYKEYYDFKFSNNTILSAMNKLYNKLL